MSSSDSEMLTPDSIKDEGNGVIENILPEMSKERYINTYNNFMKWRAEKNIKSFSENVFLTYFNRLCSKLQPSTLCSRYSMLKSTLSVKHNVNLKEFHNLTSFLKRQSQGFKSKKSKVFTSHEVETFLNDAPDEIYLAVKVVLILAISGACRSSELTNLTIKDIESLGQLLLVKLTKTKTNIERSFVVQEEFTRIVNKYQKMRPSDVKTDHFFLNYQKGKCKQGIGKNKISGNVTLKRIDFVDVLKQDLRRNNDDYAEMEKNKTNFSTSSLIAITSKTLLKYSKEITVEDTKNNISGFNRRAADGNSWEFDYNEGKTVPSTIIKKTDSSVTVTKEPLRKHKTKKIATNKLHHTKKNTSRLKTPSEINLPKINSTTKAVKSIPKLKEVISKKKIDKFKKFVAKNKELFKGILSSKPETRKDKVELKTQTNKVNLEVDNILREMRVKVKKAERAGEDEEDKLPNPDELDMAPARGGRIHRLRAKGRLCHRHVLLPEGPKYDSAGRWYVPEHRAAARREYDATPRPRLLLPRCCNCCKKSVLGCQ